MKSDALFIIAVVVIDKQRKNRIRNTKKKGEIYHDEAFVVVMVGMI